MQSPLIALNLWHLELFPLLINSMDVGIFSPNKPTKVHRTHSLLPTCLVALMQHHLVFSNLKCISFSATFNLGTQKKVTADELVTQKTVQEALDILRGAVTIVYPMGLPPHEPIKAEFENNEDLSGKQVCWSYVSPSVEIHKDFIPFF